MFEKKNKIEITEENALLLAKYNPEMAFVIAETMLKKGEEEKIVEIFKINPRDALLFIHKHTEFASKLAILIPEKIDEIINITDLPRLQLIDLALSFHNKMLDVVRMQPDIAPKLFHEALYNVSKNYNKNKDEKKAVEFLQKKICEIGEEYPNQIIPILKQISGFTKEYHESENIIIDTAKFFPEKAVEIAIELKLEMAIAKAVPSIAAKIAIERPLLAFSIIEAVPESEKEIRKHYTMKPN